MHLCLGVPSYPVRHVDRFSCYVMNTMLGGGMSSRLFQNIRERQRSGVRGRFRNAEPLSRYGMPVHLRGNVRWNRAGGKVVESILKEFKDLKENRIPPDEIRRAKDHMRKAR